MTSDNTCHNPKQYRILPCVKDGKCAGRIVWGGKPAAPKCIPQKCQWRDKVDKWADSIKKQI